jgi:uncharacterized membrane protein YhhN
MARRPLVALSATAAAIYLVTQPWQPFPASAGLKGMAMAPLAVLSFLLARTYGRGFVYLGIAQVLSCAGDVLLDLNPSYFTLGLAAFLLSHVEYATVWLLYRPRPFRTTAGRTGLAGAVLVYAVAVGAWLIPGLGDLSGPVVVYMAAITVMVVSAVFSRFPIGVGVGAILFLVSDSVLAVNKFKFPIPGRDFVIWPAYYAGQLLMALTTVRALTQRDKLLADVRYHTTHTP